ncbi:hypothetical protein BSKO_09290 [Bryopsis sp. KO-2023]|nr:hypothetical protein BSKO_09290 [Bryopsis sp. KO-2023]
MLILTGSVKNSPYALCELDRQQFLSPCADQQSSPAFRTRKIQGPFRAWSTQYQVRSVGGHASPSVDTSGFGFCFNPPNSAVLEDEEDVTADDGPLFYNPHSFDAASEAFHLGRPLPDPLTTVAAESSARSSGVSRNTTATSSSDVSKAVQDGKAVDQRHNVQLEDIADLMRRLEENWGRDPQEPGCESECLAIMQFVEAMEAQANRASGF